MNVELGRSRRYGVTIALGTLLLVVAAFGRLVAFGEAPPGLQHDEIFKAQEGIALIQQGDFRVFYPTNQGHEGAFVWVLGLSYLLVGQNVLMIKFPAFIFGMLTVALTYRVAGEMANRRVAFIAAGLVAISFWALFTSRIGLRAVMLPVVTLLVLWGLQRLLRGQSHRPNRLAILTGLALGFSIYTYTSAFALYAAFSATIIALVAFDRDRLRQLWRQLLLIAVLGAVLAVPMIGVRLTDPQGQNRVGTITRPLNDALDGRPQELIDNAWGLIGMPYFTGDPEARYNVPGRPLFATPVGLLVYIGFAVALWRTRRQPLMLALVALATVGLIPSLLTVSAPSFLRSIIALPAVMIFIALAIDVIPNTRAVWVVGAVAILVTGVTDWQAYFVRWVTIEEVHDIYRDDLAQLAIYLGENEVVQAFVSTTDTELDPIIYAYLQPPDIPVTFFDGRTTIALGTQDGLLFISPDSSITPPHAGWLTAERGTRPLPPVLRQDGEVAYEVYQLDSTGGAVADQLDIVQSRPVYIADAYERGQVDEWALALPYPVNFGDVVQLVGVELPRDEIFDSRDGVNNQLYLQPLVYGDPLPLAVFVHMIHREYGLHAQRDLLGVPPLQWQPESLFIQDNFVIAGDTLPRNYLIVMGIYNQVTGERLPVLDSNGQPIADQVIIDRVRVVPRTD